MNYKNPFEDPNAEPSGKNIKRNEAEIIKWRKIRENETVDWSKLVGEQIYTDGCGKPQLVCKNGTLEERLLALSGKGHKFIERGYLIARCTDGEYKQSFTSFCPDTIHPEDTVAAFHKLHEEIDGKWSRVITLEFVHTHSKSQNAYDPLSPDDIKVADSQDAYAPLSQDDIEVADSLAEQLYRRGVKNVIMTAASENGYSFKYFPPSSAFNSKYKKMEEAK